MPRLRSRRLRRRRWGGSSSDLAASRIRDNQRFLVSAAASSSWCWSRSGWSRAITGAPQAAIALDDRLARLAHGHPRIDATVEATGPVDVGAIVDGTRGTPTDAGPGESVSFMAQEQLTVTASDGGAVRITVDGLASGVPGVHGQPWTRTLRGPRSST